MVLELALELGVEVQVVPLELGMVLELSELALELALALEQPQKLLPQQHEGKLEELEEMAVGQAEGKEVEPWSLSWAGPEDRNSNRDQFLIVVVQLDYMTWEKKTETTEVRDVFWGVVYM